MKRMNRNLLALGLLALFALPVLAQPEPPQRFGDRLEALETGVLGGVHWLPASHVFVEDGSLRLGVVAQPPGGERVVVYGNKPDLARTAAMWRSRSLEHVGSAKALGLRDGEILESRRHCMGTMRSAEELLMSLPLEMFGDWTSQAEALLEGVVQSIDPGFNAYGDPASRIALKVVRHLFPARTPLPEEVHLVLPVAEFVAADAVFCGLEAWHGYRPVVGDRLVISTYHLPMATKQTMLNVFLPGQMFIVSEDDFLTTPDGSRPSASFPVSFGDLADRVRVMWASGALDGPPYHEILRLKREERRQKRQADEWFQ